MFCSEMPAWRSQRAIPYLTRADADMLRPMMLKMPYPSYAAERYTRQMSLPHFAFSCRLFSEGFSFIIRQLIHMIYDRSVYGMLWSPPLLYL